MNYKDFVDGLLNDEITKLENAEKDYGEFYTTAIELIHLLYKYIYKIDTSGFIFISYLSQIQKHLLLSIFSTIRLHHDESQYNIRKSIESIVLACYSIKHTNENLYIVQNGKNLSKPLKKHYDWLESKYLIESNYLKGVKDIINSGSAHSNITHAMFNIKHREDENLFETNFFDTKNDIMIKSNLNVISKIILNSISLFNKLNEEYKVMSINPEFRKTFHNLAKQSNEQKNELKKLLNI